MDDLLTAGDALNTSTETITPTGLTSEDQAAIAAAAEASALAARLQAENDDLKAQLASAQAATSKKASKADSSLQAQLDQANAQLAAIQAAGQAAFDGYAGDKASDNNANKAGELPYAVSPRQSIFKDGVQLLEGALVRFLEEEGEKLVASGVLRRLGLSA